MFKYYDYNLDKIKPEAIDMINDIAKTDKCRDFISRLLTERGKKIGSTLKKNKIIEHDSETHDEYYKCTLCNKKFYNFKQHIKSNKHIESMNMDNKNEELNKKNNNEDKDRLNFWKQAEKENIERSSKCHENPLLDL